MQRCHCCARLWRGASTSVVKLLPRVGFEGTSTVYRPSHVRRRAFLGPMQAEQKLCSQCCKSKQLLSAAPAAQKALPSKVVVIA